MNTNPWDRANPSAESSRRSANHSDARSSLTVKSAASERAITLATARPPQVPGEAGLGSRFLRAHLAWILLITLAVTAGAYVVAKAQRSIYTSQATVVVFAESAAASTQQAVTMATEKGIVSSEAVLSIASQSEHLSQRALQNGLSVTVPVDTDLLEIAFSDPNRTVARDVAQGIANAYVEYRTPKTSTVPAGSKTPAPAVPGAVQPSMITAASLPTSPTSPNRSLDLAVGVLLGLALGTGVALARDAVDDRLRGRLDLAAQADAPVLAQIPAFRGQQGNRLVLLHNPGSRVADAYRDLRTRVLQAAGRRGADVIIVTSPAAEDRATVASNLAAALAVSGRRVILVGADLRWGRTHELFGLSNGIGISNVLSGNASLTYALRDTRVGRLQLLSSGPSVADPAALLQSPALPRLLGQLRGRADFVVIDAPPVLASADTETLAEFGDVILLVADAKVTRRAHVRAAKQQLEGTGNDRIYCVFDNVGRAHRLPVPSPAPAPVARRAIGAVNPVAAGPNGHKVPTDIRSLSGITPVDGKIVGDEAAGRARRERV